MRIRKALSRIATRGALLASFALVGCFSSEAQTMSASPNPIYITSGTLGSTTITWSFAKPPVGDAIAVYAAGSLFCSSGINGTGGVCPTGVWVDNGMVFTLKDEETGIQYASLTVSVVVSCSLSACDTTCENTYNSAILDAQAADTQCGETAGTAYDTCEDTAETAYEDCLDDCALNGDYEHMCDDACEDTYDSADQYCEDTYDAALANCDITYTNTVNAAATAESSCENSCSSKCKSR